MSPLAQTVILISFVLLDFQLGSVEIGIYFIHTFI